MPVNILVVEDEALALEELVDLMKPFEARHRVWSASNGVEGYRLAERIKPDLLITDIRMPGMDGLQLIRAVKEIRPEVEAVLISGYDDFEYAREGIQLRAKDYLLKPIRKKTFLETIDRVIREIESSRESKDRSREQVFVNMLNGYDDSLEREFALDHAMVLILSVPGNIDAAHRWYPDRERRNMQGLALPEGTMTVFPDLRKRCVLVPLDRPVSPVAVRKWAEQVHFGPECPPSPTQTVYLVKEAGVPLHEAYRRALQTLEEQIRLDASTIIAAERDKPDAARDFSALWEKVRMLEVQMEARDTNRIRQEIGRISAELKGMRATVRDIELFLNDLFTALSFKMTGGLHEKIAGWAEVKSFLRQAVTHSELETWMFDRLTGFLGRLGTKNLEPKELVKLLIHQVRHACEIPVSLQQFARDHHVSVSYLSRLFKAEAGISFMEYVTRVRMEQAKRMLASSDISPSEVARRVGYEDAKYFSQTFKKRTGRSPSEYQRNSRSGAADGKGRDN